jgi:hypothetical protein
MTKPHWTTLIALIGLVLLISSAAADDFHYYFQGEQIGVELSDSLITIIPDEGYQPNRKDALEVDHPCIDDSYPPAPVNSTSWTYHLSEGWEPDSAIIVLHGVPGVKIVNPVLSTPDSVPVYITDEFIVRFDSVVFPYAWFFADSFFASHGVEIIQHVDTIDEWRYVVRMTGTTADELLELSNALYFNDSVEYATPNFYNDLTLDAAPNDPYYGNQWYLKNTGQSGGTPGADIDFEPALTFPLATEDVVIAIIDVGWDLNHEDFDLSRIIQTLDVAGNAFADSNNVWDPDVSIPADPPDKQEEWWAHGMHVLGLINAVMDNGLGVVGIAPTQKFRLYKIVDSTKTTNDASLGMAIRCAAVLAPFDGCDIIVMPWHKMYPTDDMQSAMKWAYYLSAVTFAPSGDEGGQMAYPATSEYVISVGATNEWDMVESWSARGPALDVVAPGWDIWTLDRMGLIGSNPEVATCAPNSWNYFCKFWGTSASCAIAAAVGARILATVPDARDGEDYQLYNPLLGLPFDYVREALRISAEDMVGSDQTPGWDQDYGHGRVNAFRAISTVAGGDADGSQNVDVDDIVYLINYVFGGGAAPTPYLFVGDANCSGGDIPVDIDDIVFLINFVFGGGPDPRVPCPHHLE